MKIRLHEIPADGRDYDFSRETGEFNGVLRDLIDDRPYDIRFTIRPLGNAYEVRGTIETSASDVCSSCGWDIEIPVSRAMKEVLMEDQEEYRKSKSVHGNQSLDLSKSDDGGLDVTFYQNGVFDADEFVHEAIALGMPFYPKCPQGKCQNLDIVEAKRRELEAEFQRAEGRIEGAGHPAFAVLKSLKQPTN